MSILRRLFWLGTVVLFEHRHPARVESPCTVVAASQENLADVLDFESPRQLAVYERFMREGARGYLAYLDGRCVHRSWVQLGPGRVTLFRRLFRALGPEEAYIHYCETASEARGKNVYPAVLARVAEDLAPSRRLLIATTLSNRPSVRGIEKAGFVCCQRFLVAAVLRWTVVLRREDPLADR